MEFSWVEFSWVEFSWVEFSWNLNFSEASNCDELRLSVCISGHDIKGENDTIMTLIQETFIVLLV